MNWKLSSAVIRVLNVLAAMIGLGFIVGVAFSFSAIFASTSRGQRASPPQPSPTSDIDTSQTGPTPNWKLYRNEKYGFEVRYPKDFVLETTISPGIVKGPVVSFRLTGDDYYSGNNLREASVVIGIRQDEGVLSTCLIPEAMSVYKGESLAEQEINSITFYKDLVEEGAAGHHYEKISYRTINKDTCYEIALLIHSTNMGVFDPGTVSEFNEEEVVEKLVQVLSTFRFLKATAVNVAKVV